MRESATILNTAKSASFSDRLPAAIFGFLIGAFILIGVGFANVNLIHNAAHDARHINAFPCH